MQHTIASPGAQAGPADTPAAPGYKAPAVHKAFQILKTVAKSPEGLGLVALSEKLGYSKSTTHGLVHALLREGVLAQGSRGKKLFLGPMIAELMFESWDQEKVHELAQPVLDDIRDTVRETVVLGARLRRRVLILATAETYDSFKISVPVGSTIPLIAGAVGKAFLAQSDPETAAQLLQTHGLREYTPASITDPGTYLEELNRVRRTGYAVDIEEYLPGIKAVAVALKNLRGLPIALWVVGMSAGMDAARIERIATLALDRAGRLRDLLDERPAREG